MSDERHKATLSIPRSENVLKRDTIEIPASNSSVFCALVQQRTCTDGWFLNSYK